MAKRVLHWGGIVGITASLLLSACGSSPNVPANSVQGSGIVASFRDDNTVTILYQEASTSTERLKAEANRICGKIGKRAGSSRDVNLMSSGRIPGVDARILYQCI